MIQCWNILSYLLNHVTLDNGTIPYTLLKFGYTLLIRTVVYKPIAIPSSVHLTTAFLTHCILTCSYWTYSTSPTDDVCYVGHVKKASVLFLDRQSVNIAPTRACRFINAPLVIAGIVLVIATFISNLP